MSSLVIVALPAEDDLVWKVSSEKVPHLTLMYLGEIDSEDAARSANRMAEFVEHALNINEHGPFYLTVDYRGELGPDKADVLYFEGGWDSKWIKQLRGHLLQQNDIRKAFEENDQFPEWVPHLTLGYSESPAKEVPDDRRFYSVEFDRLAVWTGDYEGPEFRLKWPERDDMYDQCLAYTADRGAAAVAAEVMTANEARIAMGLEALEHFGTKGMKWGVRKDKVANAVSNAAQKAGPKIKSGLKAVGRGLAAVGASLAESAWQGSTYSDSTHEEIHNHVAKEIDNHVAKLQKSPKYRGKNLHADANLRNEYYQDVAKVTDSAYRRAVKDTVGTSPSGTKSAHYINDVRGARIEVRDKKSGFPESESPLSSMKDIQTRKSVEALKEAQSATHAATTDAPDLEIEIKLDDNGQISGVGFVPPTEGMVHSMADGEAFVLEHFGVKGMRWGFRRERPAPEAVAPSATSKVPHGTKRKTKIETQGGENHPAHEDAIKVAQAQVKLKKSGAAALSNQELRDVATRVQLENQVSLLTGHKGKQFVRGQLEAEGKNLAKAGLREGLRNPAGTAGAVRKTAKGVRRGAAVAATTAALL